MSFDFAALPPEVNSSLMYSGSGSGPLMAAASAWGNLAAELSTTATSWDSIIANLSDQWTGIGATSAAAAAQPYVGWLSTTAAAAEQASTLATSAAAAYEAAFAATVPPPLIAANRAQLAALVATNFLGINTPAIMATEALYAEMWVQDAVTMATYQVAATASSALSPLTPAAATTSPTAAATQAAAVPTAFAATTAQGVIQDLLNAPTALGTELWTAVSNTPLGPLLTSLDGLLGTPLIFNGIQEVGVTAAWFVGNTIPTAVSLGHTLAAAAPAAVGVSSVTPLGAGAAIGEGALVNSVSGAGASAALGEASMVGSLSVPAGWSAAAPATLASSTAPLEGSGWTVASEAAGEPVTAMPGMPGMGAAAKGAGAYAAPRYGVKPIVMPKQVVV